MKIRPPLISKFAKALPFAPVAFVLLALGLQHYLNSFMNIRSLLLLYPALALGCFFGNRISNLTATILGIAGAWFLFLPHQWTLMNMVGLLVFFGSSVLLGEASQRLWQSRQQTQKLRQLESGMQKRAEEREQILNDFADVISSMREAFFLVDRDWKLIHVNPQYERLGGVKAQNRLGTSFKDILIEHQLLDTKYWTQYHQVMNERIPAVFEDYYPRLKMWTECRAYPTNNGGMAVFFADITEQKESIKRQQNWLDTLPVLASMTSPEGRILLTNEASRRILGEKAPDVVGRFFWDAGWWAGLPHVQEKLKMHLHQAAQGSPQRFDVEFRNWQAPDSSGRWAEVSMIPVVDSKGSIETITVSSFDITDRVNSEKNQQDLLKKLSAAKEEAERANQLKSAFLANMSHEIRTPLGAMLGFAELLLEPALEPAQREEFVRILVRNGHQLNEIINDVLDISKIEAGHLQLELSSTRLRPILFEVQELLSLKAEQRKLHLDFSVDPQVPEDVLTDPLRLRQILINVVGNALKFTLTGKVEVQVSLCSPTELRVEILDTGIGIPETEHERIFEPFVQADGSLARRFGGTGIGLALSRKLARALGGELSLLRSEPQRGSAFGLTLPLKQSSPHSARPEPPTASL